MPTQKPTDDNQFMDKKIKRLVKKNGLVKFTLPSRTSEKGNAYFIMGDWERQAKKADWSQDDIDTIMALAMSGDYERLRAVFAATSKG